MWPFVFLQSWMQTASAVMGLALDAQSVVNLRLMGLAGLRPSPRGECWRMIQEKPQAFWAAGLAWQKALLAGGDWHAQTQAATRPLARKARSNHRRLARR
ncbi:antifreeze protein [Tropicibacter oceani]|uniref:Antifreeze protein n=1 Tax=Tropicibacter oceani TaxID=3058420 RepID=A0ABY8QHA3_9RHOB|nr:antifreeze protein [Tropicibacter oceani]WGW03542.1 antifreeze protein [Tropicibacter oceani]